MTDIDKKQQVFAWKLKNDRLWYMENFLKIRNKQSQLVPFSPNSAQKKFNQIIEENTKNGKLHRYIILKARQLGMSTFTEGYIYHKTSTNSYINSLIIAHEEKATLNLFNMSKLFYEECPLAIRPMKKYSNGKELVFENPTADDAEKLDNPGLRSKITIATAGTSDTARSGTYHNVHVSEIAFFPNPQNTMTALLQCVPDEMNTFVCMESTANGIGGYFYDMWNAAVEGKNDFIPIFFPWFEDENYSTPFLDDEEKQEFIAEVELVRLTESGVEEYTEEWLLKEQFNLTWEQLNWRKKTIANKCGGDLQMFHQEYPATPQEAFIASGRPRFNLNSVRKYELTVTEPKITCDLHEKDGKTTVVKHPDGFCKIWKLPDPKRTYCIGGDVAEGLLRGDYSVLTVLSDELEIVAKWRGHIDPDLLGDECVKLARLYNEAYVAIENNNHGLTTIKSMLRREYYNMFFTKSYDKISDSYTKKVGFSTNRKTKPLAIDALAEYIREMYLVMFDIDIIYELYTYVVDDNGATNAQEGKHDDCVMSLAIALQAFLEGRGEDYIPEVSMDDVVKKRKFGEDETPEIIDSLFEEDEFKEEFS